MTPKPTKIPINEIHIGPRMRALDQRAVEDLAKSMEVIGQISPITVRRTEKGYELVAGLHRLEGARLLGWREIAAVIFVGSAADARKWEIAENLHRAELTALERDKHIAEWIRLTDGKDKLAQVAPVSGGRGNEGGINAAARELGIERTDAQRAVRVASITEEAQAAAREAGVDDNRSALLAVAKESPDQQVAKVAEIANQKRRPRKKTKREKADKAQRKAAKEGVEESQSRQGAESSAALRKMATIIIEDLPAESLRNFVKDMRAVEPLVCIADLERCLREMRPAIFETDGDDDAAAAASVH
jgi:ParB-like chromosome segregation protein Spo0J